MNTKLIIAPETNQFIGFNPSILVAQILSGRELAAVSALTTSRSAPLCPPCFQYVMVRPKLGPEDARTARNGLQKQTPSPVQSTQKFFSGRRASADPPSDLVLIRNLLASVAAAATQAGANLLASWQRWPSLAQSWACHRDSNRGPLLQVGASVGLLW